VTVAVALQPGDAYALGLLDAENRTAVAAIQVAHWLRRLENDGRRPTYQRACRDTANKLLRLYPDKHLDDVSTGDIDQLLASYPAKSRPIRRAHLNSLYRYAVDADMATRNPVEKAAKPRQRQRDTERTIFDEAEKALLCGPGIREVRDRALMNVMFYTGLRISELIHLRARHVDFERRRLIVQADTAKGGKGRTVQLRRLLPVLDELITVEGVQPDEYLWYSQYGGGSIRRIAPKSATAFYAWFDRMLNQAEVPKLALDRETGLWLPRTPHSCRHTYATHWIEGGGSLERLSLELGHSDPQTTWATYCRPHLNAEAAQADLERIDY
jgi:integrase